MTRAAQRAETVGIVGAGSFGTALGYVLAKAGRSVVLWSRDPEIVAAIRTTRICPRLRTPALGPSLEATADPRVLADRARFIVMAVTSTDVANRAIELGSYLDGSHIVVHAVGALPRATNESAGEPAAPLVRVSDVVGQGVPTRKVGVIAGPALAADLVDGTFASMVAASRYHEVVAEARRLLHTPPQLRVYTSKDLVGVELASALAGAYTVALGLCDGLQMSAGPRAVLVTRAVAEASRLGAAVGAEPRTFAGLAGLGNLLVRAVDRSADYQLGRRLAVVGDDGVSGSGSVGAERTHTEGVRAAHAAIELAAKANVPMPVLAGIVAVLSGRASPRQALDSFSDTVGVEE